MHWHSDHYTGQGTARLSVAVALDDTGSDVMLDESNGGNLRAECGQPIRGGAMRGVGDAEGAHLGKRLRASEGNSIN
jgi:hypothetical protein